ncbi:hypothetical protein TNCV_864741 [Trichonephila clavipes]|nr:hypothetical protein TNCV_864741 [Trichonephila clavipes]
MRTRDDQDVHPIAIHTITPGDGSVCRRLMHAANGRSPRSRDTTVFECMKLGNLAQCVLEDINLCVIRISACQVNSAKCIRNFARKQLAPWNAITVENWTRKTVGVNALMDGTFLTVHGPVSMNMNYVTYGQDYQTQEHVL